MAAMLSSLLLPLLITVGSWQLAFCKPKQGVWDFSVDDSSPPFSVSTSAFTNTQLSITLHCEKTFQESFNIYWIFGKLHCANNYNDTETGKIVSDARSSNQKGVIYEIFSNYAENSETFNCATQKLFRLTAANFTEVEQVKKPTKESIQSPKDEKPKDEKPKDEKPKDESAKPSEKAITKRDAKPEDSPQTNQDLKNSAISDSKSQQQKEDPKSSPIKDTKSETHQNDKTSESKDSKLVPSNKVDHDSQELLKVPQDGFYLLVVNFFPLKNATALPKDLNLKVNVRISNGDSYIAAVDRPLLYFYGIMGLVYICYGIIWLFMLACNWRDLLRVQFWIGGVILLGMLEKAVFFAEYENINKTGQSVRGAIIFAELVSCLKRTLARMLVIIVSLGYGIVKPRLGQTFHKILAVGLVFFILASIEGCMRALAENGELQSKQQLLPGVPLAVTDALIFFWIFTSLLQTTRTLRLRRNVVKLSLYRHFTNTLIFTILASVAFMIWSLTQHKFKNCISDWKELWLDEAFWHLLFSIILIVIMILWRPTANNQRYAFSPLLDAAEDELDDDVVLSEAYDGMKMRSKQQKNGGSNVNEDGKNEDDLKWVEENIPTSFADKLLPALDSDEEIMNTKFEVSKME